MRAFGFVKKNYVTFIFLFSLIIGLAIFKRLKSDPADLNRPNIIILSFCSLRQSDLENSPELRKLSGESYVFKNVFARHSWVNLFQYVYKELNPQFFKKRGYDLLSDHADWPFFSVPAGVDSAENYKDLGEKFNLNFKSSLGLIKQLLSGPHLRPFYTFIQFKYMHYPLIDNLNKDQNWAYFLTSEEKKYTENILNFPEKYKKKLPFILMLTGKSKYINFDKQLNNSHLAKAELFLKQYSIFNDREYLIPWMSEPSYKIDLRILHQVYRAKLRYLTKNIDDLLNLYNIEDLKKNSILIIVGDHGESLMEHDTLGHSFNVFDETLHVPLMIKLPDQVQNKIINDQIFAGSLGQFIREVVNGESVSEARINNLILSSDNDNIILRNCNKTEFGMRSKNHWKFIMSPTNQNNQLFDLTVDPLEKNNVSSFHPEIAAKMRLVLNNHLSDLNQVSSVSRCQ